MFLKKSFHLCTFAVATGCCVVALCAALPAAALAQSGEPVPVLKKTLQGHAAAPGQRVQLEVPAGQVVQLRFAGTDLHLDLRTAQGQHLRRLAESGQGVQTAMWRSQGSAQEQLWVVPARAQAVAQPYRLEVLKTWPSDGPAPLQADDTPMGPRLQALQRSLAAGAGTDDFWRAVQKQGTPLVEPWQDGQQLVTFLWRDHGHTNVRLFGSPSGDHNPLQKLADSDVWWTSVVMDPRARLSYALAPDVPQLPPAQAAQQRRMILATLQRDPLNLHPFPSRPSSGVDDMYQGRSSVTLAQAPAQPWVAARKDVAPGQLTRHTVHSAVLGNDRDVWTYVPAGVTPAMQQGLLVLFDAHAFVHEVPTPRILDNLIADGLLPPMAAVIVGNASPEARGEELPPNPKFAQFMAQELMPWVKAQGLSQLARHTVVLGSSYGGLVSSYLGLMHPELFGNVLSMSGSYWWAPQGEPPGWMQRAWQALPEPLPQVRFYLDAGWFERGRGGRNGILETSRELGSILRARGLPVTQREWVSGHDYLQWQGTLGCGLVALWSPALLERGDARVAACTGTTVVP